MLDWDLELTDSAISDSLLSFRSISPTFLLYRINPLADVFATLAPDEVMITQSPFTVTELFFALVTTNLPVLASLFMYFPDFSFEFIH